MVIIQFNEFLCNLVKFRAKDWDYCFCEIQIEYFRKIW